MCPLRSTPSKKKAMMFKHAAPVRIDNVHSGVARGFCCFLFVVASLKFPCSRMTPWRQCNQQNCKYKRQATTVKQHMKTNSLVETRCTFRDVIFWFNFAIEKRLQTCWVHCLLLSACTQSRKKIAARKFEQSFDGALVLTHVYFNRFQVEWE